MTWSSRCPRCCWTMTTAFSSPVFAPFRCDRLATQLALTTLQLAPNYIPKFRKMVPNLVKRLRTVISGNGKADCMVGSVPDPFVQVKMLQLLCLLCDDDKSATDDVIDVVSLVGTRSPLDRRSTRRPTTARWPGQSCSTSAFEPCFRSKCPRLTSSKPPGFSADSSRTAIQTSASCRCRCFCR